MSSAVLFLWNLHSDLLMLYDHYLLKKKQLFFVEFQPELAAAIQGQLDLSDLKVFEDDMVSPFVNPDPTKKWREGMQKCCFNYLLLDPRVTQNLPVRIKSIGL